MVCWNEWPNEYKNWKQNDNLMQYEKDVKFEMFLQYIFYKQWIELKQYANKNNIQIMGDISFYVGIDSQEVWSEKQNFLLDEEGQPTFVGGVPPDLFSKTGQRWGNPIYNWNFMKENNYDFWVKRIAYNSQLFDILRIDHFRAFDTFWKVPSSCSTAVEGEWIEAPGYEALDAILKKNPNVQIVVEDLGQIRSEVRILKEHYHFKGMRILQYCFGKEDMECFKPIKNLILYTGNDDNQTTKAWY